MSAYPERLHPRTTRSAMAIYGIAGLAGFALAFLMTWYFPAAGVAWIALAAGKFLFSLVFSRKAILQNLIVLILTCAAVFSAAALH